MVPAFCDANGIDAETRQTHEARNKPGAALSDGRPQKAAAT
jgi:hypothetical protein